MTAIWLPILVKAVATALIVVLASALAEVLGPFWGALVASLPVSAGPAYVFLAMRHDGDFVAASALASFAANAATGLFLIVYGALASRAPPWRGLGIAIAIWLIAALGTLHIVWSPATAFFMNLTVYGAGFWLTPRSGTASVATPPARRRWFELPARAVAVAGFVSCVVAISATLGSQATGIAAVFPISLISLFVIARPRIGAPACAEMAANALHAMLGFGVMLLIFHLAIRPCGTAAALGIALSVSVIWSLALFLFRASRRSASPRTPGRSGRGADPAQARHSATDRSRIRRWLARV